MNRVRTFILGVMLFVLLIPSPAAALGVSFGGRIVAVTPCIGGLGPSIWVKIIPAGIFPVAYVWTPLTLTYLAGPPRNIGQQVLGVADTPYVCKVGTVPLVGLRMQIVGTSAI
ncbi:hypothetical protein IT396_03705 [Candidatus Nomurabacteria bacterium]|nr:hypothetical protein [Candidatus Nomurabacteria bacterium]